jgi:hypothetical protein
MRQAFFSILVLVLNSSFGSVEKEEEEEFKKGTFQNFNRFSAPVQNT